MPTDEIDWDTAAQDHGGVVVSPAQPNWDELAKEHGAEIMEPDTSVGSFLRGLKSKAVSGLGGAAGAAGAAILATPESAGALTIPAALAGAEAGSYLGEKAYKAMMGDEAFRREQAQLEANRIAGHELAGGAGEMIPAFIAPGVAGKEKALAEGASLAEKAIAGTKSAAKAGLIMGGASEAQRQADEGRVDFAALATHPIEEAIKFGPVGLIPAARGILGHVMKGIPDAAVMTLSSQLYDHVVHDKPLNLSGYVDETGKAIPSFLLLNALTSVMHGRLPTPKKGAPEGMKLEDVPESDIQLHPSVVKKADQINDAVKGAAELAPQTAAAVDAVAPDALKQTADEAQAKHDEMMAGYAKIREEQDKILGKQPQPETPGETPEAAPPAPAQPEGLQPTEAETPAPLAEAAVAETPPVRTETAPEAPEAKEGAKTPAEAPTPPAAPQLTEAEKPIAPETNAHPEQGTIPPVRGEAPGPPAQVAEGKPGEVQQPAGAQAEQPPEKTEAEREVERLRTSQKEYRDRRNLDVQQGRLDRSQADKMIKGNGMKIAAQIRQITGELTPRERAEKEKREAGNYRGKPVTVDGKPGKVTGNAYGGVAVKFDDGSVGTFHPDKIEPIKTQYSKGEKGDEEKAPPAAEGSYATSNAEIERMAENMGLEAPPAGDPKHIQQMMASVSGENYESLKNRVMNEIPKTGKVNERDQFRVARVINELNKRLGELHANALKGGHSKSEMSRISKDMADTEAQLTEAFKINRALGSLYGRGLRFRQQLISEDFTMAGMEERLKANQGGEPIDKEQRKALEEIVEGHKKFLAEQSKLESEGRNVKLTWKQRVGQKLYSALFGKRSEVSDDVPSPGGKGLSINKVRDFLANRGLTEGHSIKVVNSDELTTPDEAGNRYTWDARIRNGKIEINAKQIRDEEHLNEKLTHELGHLASKDKDVVKHWSLLKNALTEGEKKQLSDHLDKYASDEKPGEEVAEVLKILSRRKSTKAKMDNLVTKIQRAFEKITGIRLGKVDAERMAVEAIARAEGKLKKADAQYAKGEKVQYGKGEEGRSQSTEEFNADIEKSLLQETNLDAAIERAIALSSAKGLDNESFLKDIQDTIARNENFKDIPKETIEQMVLDYGKDAFKTKKELQREKAKAQSDIQDAPKESKVYRQIQARIKNLEKRIAEGNFIKEQKDYRELSDKEYDLKLKEDELRRKLYGQLIEARRKNRTLLKRATDGLADSVNLARSVMTGLDFSAVLRQGIFPTLANPVRSLKILPKMFAAMRSEDAQHAVMNEIRRRPNAQWYEAGGLFLKDPTETSPSAMEEAFMSRFTAKWPRALGGGLIRGSERAYVTFLNRLRADVFDDLAASFTHPDGMDISDAKAIANAANVLTGRGKIGFKDKGAATGLNMIFFAPNYVASIFNTMFGQPFYHGSGAVKKAVAQEYARFLGGAALIYGLASMTMGPDDGIETDPRSSDFGRLRYHNTRLNPLGGILPNTTLLSRVYTGQTKTLKGQVKSLRGPDKPYGGRNVYDVISDFARMKFSPVISTVVNTATGTNAIGEPTNLGKELGRMVYPMSLRDVQEAMQDQGIPKGTALSILSLFGMGVNSFNPNEPRK